jgi:hypothetical protein
LEREGFPIIQKAFFSNRREEDAIASSDMTKTPSVIIIKHPDLGSGYHQNPKAKLA